MGEAEATAKQKRATHRSPSYPMFSLREAIEKARVIYNEDRRTFTTPDVIAQHLGFSQPVGGPGGRTMSALRQYGLLEESEGKSRISERAYILTQYPPESPERSKAIRDAIREPNLFRELLDEYPESLPSDAALHSNLLKRGFNPEVIGDVIDVLRDTVSLDQGKNVEYSPIRIGDYVQWVSQGADQFDKPQRVKGLSDNGSFAFVDSTSTGIPIEQLTKVEPPTEEKELGGGKLIIKRPTPKPGMNNEVFALAEGEVVLQWPDQMSLESYEDFKDWLELITRKAKRMVEKKAVADPTND